MEEDGFVGRLDFKDKQFWVVVTINDNKEVACVKVGSSIYCNDFVKPQVNEYINKIINDGDYANLKISETGYICAYAEQRFTDAPISNKTFRMMEYSCARTLETFYNVLNKLANGMLITPKEAELVEVIIDYDDKLKIVFEVDEYDNGTYERNSLENTNNDSSTELDRFIKWYYEVAVKGLHKQKEDLKT